ncbi:hypothetical protein MPH_04439 [Macrophomina phaseolina MS6]|uniref:Uncharacterized protein n=1 Tax=Macrophomina phaseolina (strain MS6) TaxID=1126212 RepID=K2RZZ9_MACPH|nr:hypothetical protein MPH_04439 [Macrophomina phaseolina MS6]
MEYHPSYRAHIQIRQLLLPREEATGFYLLRYTLGDIPESISCSSSSRPACTTSRTMVSSCQPPRCLPTLYHRSYTPSDMEIPIVDDDYQWLWSLERNELTREKAQLWMSETKTASRWVIYMSSHLLQTRNAQRLRNGLLACEANRRLIARSRVGFRNTFMSSS